MKKLLSIVLVLILAFAPVSVSAATKFKDVPSSYWAASHIAEANDLGIIFGYSNGTFGPKKNVNKQEAFVMIFRIMKNAGLVKLSGYIEAAGLVVNPPAETEDGNTDLISDTVPPEPGTYVVYVEGMDPDSKEGEELLDQCVEQWQGVLDECKFSDNTGMRRAAAYGLTYGICEPSDFAAGAKTDASRELIAKWSCNALDFELAPVAVLPYKDASSVSPECVSAVDALYRHGIMVGGTDGKFKPQTGIIRAEIAAIAVRMLKDVQSEHVLTLDNTLVNIYGKVTGINTETGVLTMDTKNGAKYLCIDRGAQIYVDGMAIDLWNLNIPNQTGISVSALNGGENSIFSVYIQSKPVVQEGTVMGSVQQFSDFYMVTILQSGGVSNTFVFTDNTLGRLPLSGSYITFIADGLELLEVK